MDLPQVRPYNSIHIIVDRGIKRVVYTLCTKTIDVEGTAVIYMKNI